jgi:hypothetical protein
LGTALALHYTRVVVMLVGRFHTFFGRKTTEMASAQAAAPNYSDSNIRSSPRRGLPLTELPAKKFRF